LFISNSIFTFTCFLLFLKAVLFQMMGPDGLEKASKLAILNANYMAKRLENFYKVNYNVNNFVPDLPEPESLGFC